MDFAEITDMFTSLISILVLYQVHRLNRKQIANENIVDRGHSGMLTTLSHAYSKEAHAANHLYTRKASHLENAGKIVGDLRFWAEKCVVPRTMSDFGTKKQIASKMSMAFEDLSQLSMQYPIAFKEIKNFQRHMSNLMGYVNCIENLTNSDSFDVDLVSEEWRSAVSSFRNELSPLTEALQLEIEKLMLQV